MIVRCEILPGSRLTEKDLIARLGFGRTPVREALLRLNQDRIVDTKPRSGYRVRPLTYRSVDDFFVAWRAVAQLIAELAFRNMTDADREFLIGLGQQRKHTDPQDVEGYRQIASAFFDRLTQMADSEPLSFIYNRFGAEMDRLFRIFFPTPKGREWVAAYTDMQAWVQMDTVEDATHLIHVALEHVHAALLTYVEASLKAGDSHFTVETQTFPTATRGAATAPPDNNNAKKPQRTTGRVNRS
jgi:DNA-binding GntR family transcriptional regulator